MKSLGAQNPDIVINTLLLLQYLRSRRIRRKKNFEFLSRSSPSLKSRHGAKGKPRDLDYPACWTGVRIHARRNLTARQSPQTEKKGYGGSQTVAKLPPIKLAPVFTHWATAPPVTSENII